MYKILLMMLMLMPAISYAENPFSQEVMQRRNVSIQNYAVAHSQWNWAQIKIDGGLIHPNTEYKAAIDFLYLQDPDTRPFIKFLTNYAVPNDLREKTVLTASFVIHSNVAWSNTFHPTYRPLALQDGERFIPQQLVPGSSTLYWIDIRDYGWDNRAFEEVVLNDGYFVSPIIDERLAFLLEAEGLSPNILLRMDWFAVHAFDAQREKDRGLVSISDTLIYSRLSRPPKTLDELKQLWAVENGIEYTTLVTKSQAVSRHNRVLAITQGRFGRFYDTFDVLFQEGARDYLEDIFNFNGNKPRVIDGGEVFWDNQLKLLVYGLYDANENLATFGDPTLVRHNGDITLDARVRVSHSCTDCHSNGPLPAENTLVELLRAGVKIRVPEFNDKAALEASYLGDGFEHEVESGVATYAQAMRRVNGLTPEQNGANYLALVAWYSFPVTIQQAAAEVGVMPDVLKQKLNGKASGRLAMMIQGNEPMPRDLWESIGFDGVPGGFQQAMVLVYGLFFKDVNITLNEVQFLQHRKHDWKDDFDIQEDAQQKLIHIEPKKTISKNDVFLNKQLDINSRLEKTLAKLDHKNVFTIRLNTNQSIGAWLPGTNSSEPPRFILRGPCTFVVIDNAHTDWVGITYSDGQRVYVQRSLVTVIQE